MQIQFQYRSSGLVNERIWVRTRLKQTLAWDALTGQQLYMVGMLTTLKVQDRDIELTVFIMGLFQLLESSLIDRIKICIPKMPPISCNSTTQSKYTFFSISLKTINYSLILLPTILTKYLSAIGITRSVLKDISSLNYVLFKTSSKKIE